MGQHQRYLRGDPRAPLPYRADRRDAARAVIRVLRAPGRALPAGLRAGADRRGEPGAHRAGDAEANAAELELHGALLDELGIPGEMRSAEPAPTNLAYTSYLLATVRGGSYAEGVGAVLPCYWIYAAVGRELLRSGSPDPRYQRWIATYGGDEYGDVVASVIAELDRVSPGLSDDERARVRGHFRVTSRYEWMFWEMGWVKESWPV